MASSVGMPNLQQVPLSQIDLTKIVKPEGGELTPTRPEKEYIDAETLLPVTVADLPTDTDEAKPLLAEAFEQQHGLRTFDVEGAVTVERRDETPPDTDGGFATLGDFQTYLASVHNTVVEWSVFLVENSNHQYLLMVGEDLSLLAAEIALIHNRLTPLLMTPEGTGPDQDQPVADQPDGMGYTGDVQPG
jgi:hypothetical protein